MGLCWLYSEDCWVYKEINRLLRGDFDSMEYLAPFMNALMRSNQYLDQSYFSGRVYRRVNLDPKELDFYSVGKLFIWRSYTSTSTEFQTSSNFGKILFIINVSNDFEKYALRVYEFSAFPAEKEILLLPNIGFQVRSITDPTSEYPNTTKIITLNILYVCVT